MVTAKTKIILSRTGIGFVIIGAITAIIGGTDVLSLTEIIGWVGTAIGVILKIIREFKG